MDRYIVDLMVANGRRLKSPHYEKLSYILKENLNKVKDGLARTDKFLTNTNPLVKLFNSLYVSGSDVEDIWLKNKYRGRITAKSLGFTTNSNVGKVFHDGVVLQPSCNEYIVAMESSMPTDTDWASWKPIKILSHDYSDFRWDFLYNRDNNGGTAVVGIDIALLALQWYRYCLTKPDPAERLDPSIWLIRYPLMHVIDDYANISFYNRFHMIVLGAEFDKDNYNLGWAVLQTPEKAFERASNDLADRVDRGELSLGDYLPNLELVTTTANTLVTQTSDWLTLKPLRAITCFIDAQFLGRLFYVWDGYGVVRYEAWLKGYVKTLKSFKSSKLYKVQPNLTGALEAHHADMLRR